MACVKIVRLSAYLAENRDNRLSAFLRKYVATGCQKTKKAVIINHCCKYSNINQ